MEKLSKSPLVYVLAQVRIGAVLKMEDYVPQIQEQMRKVGYPLYRPSEVREVHFGADKTDMTTTKRWYFDAMGRKAGFLLQAGSIVFHTTEYDTSKAFFSDLQRGLSIIHEAVEISAVERLGLRFVDAFQAERGHELGEYFQPGFRGISLEEVGATQPRLLIHLVTNTRIGGKLVIRLSQNTGGWFLPPDLQPPELTPNKRFLTDREIAVLDYDHFIERDEPFSLEGIGRTFDALHDTTSAVFRKTVSEFALEAWNRP